MKIKFNKIQELSVYTSGMNILLIINSIFLVIDMRQQSMDQVKEASEAFKTLLDECILQHQQEIYLRKNLPFLLSLFKQESHQQVTGITTFKKIYESLETFPKGVLHHVHLICCQDEQFFEKYIFCDQRIFANLNFKQITIGKESEFRDDPSWINVKKQLEAKNGKQKKQLKDQLLGITMFSPEELEECMKKGEALWSRFQAKIFAMMPILGFVDIFQKYMLHVFEKFAKNGYQRVQFRGNMRFLTNLDENADVIQKGETYDKYIHAFDSSLLEIKKTYPNFSAGLIIFGMKAFPDQRNFEDMSKMLATKWDKIVGIDFVGEQDKYQPSSYYDKIVDSLINQNHCPHIRKVYHAGETINFENQNVIYSIQHGSYRIGHGINIINNSSYLKQLSEQFSPCFELCPISNVFLGYTQDFRQGAASILHRMKIPISINPDDPGIFGYKDSTLDYYIAAMSYRWRLQDFIVIGQNSIKSALVSENQKKELMQEFQLQKQIWVENFIANK